MHNVISAILSIIFFVLFLFWLFGTKGIFVISLASGLIYILWMLPDWLVEYRDNKIFIYFKYIFFISLSLSLLYIIDLLENKYNLPMEVILSSIFLFGPILGFCIMRIIKKQKENL